MDRNKSPRSWAQSLLSRQRSFSEDWEQTKSTSFPESWERGWIRISSTGDITVGRPARTTADKAEEQGRQLNSNSVHFTKVFFSQQ